MKSKFVGKLEEVLRDVKNKAKIGILLAGAAIASFNNTSIANNFNEGSLEIENYVYDVNINRVIHWTKHYLKGTEGYDVYDMDYHPPPYGKMAKIVSIIPDHELVVDTRPTESLFPVNLELSLYWYAQSRDPLNVSNLENELWCSFPVAESTFGNKPITLWRRNIIDPNNNPNEPNNYTLSFMADIREAIDKSDFYNEGVKTAKIPLGFLDATPGSEIPYMYAQTNFKIFPGDFSLDGKVNLKDYAYWADCNPIADISGPNGLPDKEVDFYDFSLFTRDYLKDSNNIDTW